MERDNHIIRIISDWVTIEFFTTNAIIFIIVVILIAGAIFYFRKKNKSTISINNQGAKIGTQNNAQNIADGTQININHKDN